ncbi:hypothetical protein OCH239_10945 [Roseivivax halodurans JCM 10272]|uniref:Tetratricopeptide repeat protein n=1 Tax=Roseivivax halodurans JCM 10272 TaxID=1449350 RepID=X7EBN5_9RHOB|nr:tetratricopeptide repeat protein [Roseivivax halodurans]ETX13352.1 hypothetical protein OCH239_10945 [Roseivivax halodurans JCM 10272]
MSDLSFYSHMMISSDIKRASDRMHSGLMALASSQTNAMRDMTGRLDDRLSQIDDTIAMQGEVLERMNGAIDGLRKDMRTGFVEIANRLSNLDRKLGEIEKNTGNPEITLANERHRRAVELLKKGHVGDALGNVEAAIANGNGPAFRHIPAYHITLGEIRIGDHPGSDKSAVDYDAAHCAFRQAAIHLEDENKAVALCRAAASSFLGEDYERAIDTYLDALKIPHARQFTHFELAKCYLEVEHERAASHHLKHAVDMDWRMLALAATDPVMTRHGDTAERILREYSDAVIGILQNDFRAIEHAVTGPTSRNIKKIWNTLSDAVKDVDNATSDPDLVVDHAPAFGPDRDYSDQGPSPFWYEAIQKRIQGLTDENVTLLDILAEAQRDDVVERLRRGVRQWLNDVLCCTELVSAIRNDSPEDRGGRMSLRGVVRPGISIKNDAERTAEDVTNGRVASKPGLLGRLGGKRELRTHRQLWDDFSAEEIRIRTAMVARVTAVLPEIETRNQRCVEILRHAEHGVNTLQEIGSGQCRFLKPSQFIQPDQPDNAPSPS